MSRTIDCFFWNPNLRIESDLEFTYEDIGNGIELKKPVFTVEVLDKIIESIKQIRRNYLLTIDIPTVLDVIDRVNGLWMNPKYNGRKIAREVLPTVTGFSVEMVESWGFDHFLGIIKKENLPIFGKLKPSDFKEFTKLGDGLVKAYGEAKVSHSNYNPEVIGHICASNIVGIAAFESSNKVVNEFLFSKSNIVRATGGEQTRRNLSEVADKYKIPIAGHWHKFSFITIAREYLNERASEIAELVSLDVSAWDQQGCFSPQEIFAEIGGSVSPIEFAQLLAKEMEITSRALPKGSNSGKIQVLDGYYQYFKKEMMGEPVKIFPSATHQWLVIYDGNTTNFEPSPLFRVIRVKPVNDIIEIPKLVKPIGKFLQTVGVAITNDRLLPFAYSVGEVGVTNIRTISSMTLQKAWEPWDGKLPLNELFEQDYIRWVSIDTNDIDKEIKTALKRKRSIVDKPLNIDRV